jgi:hypothetical protein
MAFIQIIEFETDRIDEGQKYVDEYRTATKGKRTATRGILAEDRDNKGHYVNIVFFPSYEAAMKNSEMPETQELSANLMGLSKGAPKFYNLEVLQDQDN